MPDLRYDWNAVAQLIDEFGPDFDTVISKAAQTMDVRVIAKAVSIGSDQSVEDVMREAPPIIPTVSAVLEALNLAFHGQREAPPASDGAGNPPRTSSAKRGGKATASD